MDLSDTASGEKKPDRLRIIQPDQGRLELDGQNQISPEQAISGQASQDVARMVCSNCSFPLERFSGAQTKVLCPRCNTWLDIDPTCGGSCLSCHKTLRKEATSACTETSKESTLVNSKENNEEFRPDGVRKKHRTLFSRFATIAGKARQYLSGRFIL